MTIAWARPVRSLVAVMGEFAAASGQWSDSNIRIPLRQALLRMPGIKGPLAKIIVLVELLE